LDFDGALQYVPTQYDLVDFRKSEMKSAGAAVVWTDKRPTRLAESIFFSFVPKPAAMAPEGWSLQVLGSRTYLLH
jgi:hypothetical protein